MATIVSTTLQVFAGTTASGTQIGSNIVQQGSPATVNLSNATLGAALSPGEQYCVRAKCINDEQYETDWTAPYAFKTLIFTEIRTITGGNCSISPELDFTYNNQVLTNSECGIYISTNASGTNATKIAAPDEETAEQGWVITSGIAENTTYYVIPYVIDDLNREYKGDWAEAESINSGYAVPVVTISNTATTYNSITGNINVTTNDTISNVYLDVWPTGGGASHRINLTATTGLQTFSITDGDTDYQGNTIHINSSTEYRITVYAVNTSGGTGSAMATVTTAAQAQATISITSVTGITPTSAVVNLAYGTTP